MSNLKKIKNPDTLMRPAPFWSWNDKLDDAELRRQIGEMKEKGWGSYFMHSRVGLVTGYLSDEWMELCNSCAEEATKTGTFAWLYDEDKWPSGYAGGAVPAADEAYRSRALVLLKKGYATDADTVLCSVNHSGIDYDICKRVATLTSAWFNGFSFVDLMNPKAVRKFLDCTHEKYKQHCGKHFGNAIPGIFTDEPCYLMFGHYDVPVVPWSEYLQKYFQDLKGYDIAEHLPQLFFDTDDYRKVRFDFYDAATALFRQSFIEQYYDWCEANNLILTGHFMSEDALWYQTQWSGDVMSHYDFMHWPGVDKLGRNIENIVTIKQVTSVVDQLNKERSFSEVFGCTGGQVSFFHRKWIADWQAALGISFINHHLSLYSMRGERKRDFPANLFYQQPWWSEERGISDYFARVCAAVSEGKRQVDILVIQPLTSAWSEYSPLHVDSGYATERKYDDPFATVSKRLMEEKLDYHYGNETLMAKYGSVEGNRLKIGAHSYGCVLVPPAINLRSSTVDILVDYVKAGGKLIFSGTVPDRIDGVLSDIVFEGSVNVPSIEDAIELISEFYPNRVKIIDMYTGKNAPTVYVHSRNTDDSARYLILNTNDKREVKAKITIPDGENGLAIFDLFDGCLYKFDSADGTLDVILSPAGSLLVITGEEARNAEESMPAVIKSGVSYDDVANRIPNRLVSNFECEVMEDNILLLNEYVLEMNGKKVYEGPICNAWHNHFYTAAEGTPFRATYTFQSECELDGCFAALEVAENLDSITFNGIAVKPMKVSGELGAFDESKSWKDINFTKVFLPRIQKNMNTLVIEGRKSNNITTEGCHVSVPNWQDHKATEAEEVYICGMFALKGLSDSQYIITDFHKPIGKNLNNEGFPFYCGKVKLRAKFNIECKLSGKTLLQLNRAEMACARVMVNGKDCGAVLWKPFLIDISDAVQSGENTIVVEIATTQVNCFGPNRNVNIKECEGVSYYEFTNMEKFQKSYQLFDFGLESIGIYTD